MLEISEGSLTMLVSCKVLQKKKLEIRWSGIVLFQLGWYGLFVIISGVITVYNLYQNGLLAFSSPSQRTLTINNLQPWSLQIILVEACTVAGCASSNVINARTQEAPPMGVIGILTQVLGPRQVNVQWTSVASPNGHLYYDVYFEGLYYIDTSWFC